MDAKEYAQFVDKLCQIRNKIDDALPEMLQPCGVMGHQAFKIAFETLIRRVEHLAWLDDKGYL